MYGAGLCLLRFFILKTITVLTVLLQEQFLQILRRLAGNVLRIMIFFITFASLGLHGSKNRKKTPMCKNRICRFGKKVLSEIDWKGRFKSSLTLY